MTTKPIDCDQALRQIFEYIDRELHEQDREAMEHHLHACKACFSRMEFERLLKQKVGGLRDDQPSDRVNERVKRLLKGFRTR